MAQRFGGKYSPTPQGTPETPLGMADAAPAGAGLKSNLLFALPFLFIVKAFRGDASALFVGLGSAGLLLLAAWLTREGIKAQHDYDSRRISRRPAFPRKMFAACLTGAALLLATLGWQASFIYPFLFGMLGAFLHLGAFGPDPLRAKGMEGVDPFQTDRVARAVDEGAQYLAGMKDAILRANDGPLEARVDHFAVLAQGMFRGIESNPGDLTAARKYLTIYLMGARDATVKFADVYAANRDPKARADYESLLNDLESTFASRTRTLMTDSHTDLDVEIQVLRDRLKQEG